MRFPSFAAFYARFIETQGFENLRSLIDAIGVPK